MDEGEDLYAERRNLVCIAKVPTYEYPRAIPLEGTVAGFLFSSGLSTVAIRRRGQAEWSTYIQLPASVQAQLSQGGCCLPPKRA
jgi:hypothetical protein